ncbi:PTS mannitol transporter subunit IICBA [Nesterenkonia salmonea]|uniref:Mannitol-specific phosphotransferase enzyme IIA component n=1 Tax=Nesterenkonia salmonea TaxID=1804987 RepID=A0A5R9BB33_9MICC|nr:PTS mannitol transporter subunit IICBA [Nesterenkonia salmonea]TLP95757.1 PTS mannitol transporter subunit IICBA [Nesterenkonia salmonea]
MTTTTTSPDSSAPADKQPGKVRVGVQKFGSFLSGMIMPNIPALIAWGIITAVVVNVSEFTEDGWEPTNALDGVIFPMIHYLLPILIAMQGGRLIHETRGAVVGAVAAMGVIVGSDHLIDQFNAALPAGEDELSYVHMFIGAMIMGPLAAWLMKKLDGLWEGKIKPGFEMLVNMFSAGILGFLLLAAGFFVLAPPINWLMDALGRGVEWLIDNSLLPLTSVLIEPAKVFFLNNAINHGVLTPLGTQQADAQGSSILFLLEANPGPGLGLLLAFSVFGVGAAKATAPGAALIHFVGGIHEVYFPYVLMKPVLLLAMIAGGMTGVTTNMLLDVGLQAPAAPGSIIAVYVQSLGGGVGNVVGVTFGWVLSAAVTFAVAAVILLSSRKRDLELGDQFSSAISRTESAKGKSSSALSSLTASAANVPAAAAERIRTIYFACDAGMGSSAMGASVLRKKLSGAGITDVYVTNKAISSLPGDADLVITQQTLTDRARPKEPNAIHVSVDNFMNAPEYDEVVELVKGSEDQDAAGSTGAQASSPSAHGSDTLTAVDSGVLTQDRIRIRTGAATQEEALREAQEILVSAGAVSGDYLQAMRDREATASTFMGSELAIPHGTNDAKSAIKSSALSVVRYDGGVDWAGDQVTFVVGIAGVGDEHLQILSRIAELFSDESKVAELKAASTEAELHQLLSAVNED